MNKFTRLAQMPPAPGGMPPAPPMGAPPGMPPMPGGAPGGMPAMPMAAPAGPHPRAEVAGPLDSLAKILYDINITDLIENSAGSDPESIAMKIWTTYGGDQKGGIKQGCVGTRSEETDTTQPPSEEELKITDKKRWMRLPAGQTISDITSLDELSKMMNGLMLGTIKNTAKEQGGGPGGPGGGGPPPTMGAIKDVFIRLAKDFDDLKMYENADKIDHFLRFI